MFVRPAKFYAVGLEDMKPILWRDFGAPADAGELVYLIDSEFKDVLIADVAVGVRAKPPRTSPRE